MNLPHIKIITTANSLQRRTLNITFKKGQYIMQLWSWRRNHTVISSKPPFVYKSKIHSSDDTFTLVMTLKNTDKTLIDSTDFN